MGMAGIQPSEFWQMSPVEIYSVLTGFQEFNGGSKDQPMSRSELDELMELNPD